MTGTTEHVPALPTWVVVWQTIAADPRHANRLYNLCRTARIAPTRLNQPRLI